jgi:hypothetical protein
MNDFSSDEIRRNLRESAEDQAIALPMFTSAVDQLLDPATGASANDKATFLGVPTRRSFILGGSVVAASAIIAACSKKKPGQIPVTAPTPDASATTPTTAPGSVANDLALLSTAQSIEALAVFTYQTALDSGLVTTPAIIDTIKLFQSQHRQHADALNGPITGAGGKVVTEPNQYLLDAAVTKGIADLTDEKSVIALARDLENIAAQTYTGAAGVLTVPALRVAAMTIGNVEARHISVLNGALGYSPVPLPIMSTAKAIDPKGYIR